MTDDLLPIPVELAPKVEDFGPLLSTHVFSNRFFWGLIAFASVFGLTLAMYFPSFIERLKENPGEDEYVPLYFLAQLLFW